MKRYEEEFVEWVWNDGQYNYLEETVHDDFVGHWFDPTREDVDKAGLRAFIETARDGFPDFKMDIEFMIAEDEMVTVGFTVAGTHDGEFMGIPPTGESTTANGILVHRFDDDGMVVEAWAVWDGLGLLQQLGVVPETFSLTSFLETGARLAKQDILKHTKAN